LVEENELAAVDQLAEIAVANAVVQHPDLPQHSASVSSETRAFFRAQGPLSLLNYHSLLLLKGALTADRNMQLSRQNVQSFDSDYLIREMATRLGIHTSFGPSPSVEMFLSEWL
jgi:hypothetical protein